MTNWVTREHNPTFLRQLEDFAHFTREHKVSSTEPHLHRLRRPHTSTWIHYDTDEECLTAMRHFYNQFVDRKQLTHHGLFGMGLPGCPHSEHSRRLIQQYGGHYIQVTSLPDYKGTYPLVYWYGEQLHYIGGNSTFSKEIEDGKHRIRLLLLALQKCLPTSQGLLHEQPMIMMTSDPLQHVPQGVRILIPKPPHAYFQLVEQFKLPKNGWIMNLTNPENIRIVPLQ